MREGPKINRPETAPSFENMVIRLSVKHLKKAVTVYGELQLKVLDRAFESE